MPEFAYIARDLKGQKIAGTIDAPSQREAVGVLTGRALFPITVTQKAGSTQVQLSGLFGKRVGGQLVATTLGQLSSLLRSGVPMLRALSVMREQTSNPTLKETLSDIHKRVEEGEGIADAFARHPRVFNNMTVNMIRAGAEGGFLEDCLDRVSKFIEQQEDLKGRTVGALAYPVVIMCIGLVVVTGLLVFMVPNFASIFERMRERGELPIATEWLLAFSDLLRSWFLLIALVVAGAVAGFWFWAKTPNGKRTIDWAKIKIPIFGPIFLSLAVARFCRVLGTLLKNGVPILRSLEISRAASGNSILSDAIAEASENVTAGASLAKPLGASGHFPPMVVEMISVAEESNALETVLVEISDNLELRTFRRLELAIRMLEPLMLLGLASVVLVVVVALLLPIMKMGEAM